MEMTRSHELALSRNCLPSQLIVGLSLAFDLVFFHHKTRTDVLDVSLLGLKSGYGMVFFLSKLSVESYALSQNRIGAHKEYLSNALICFCLIFV